jgi:SAM-dependent methyltransferase
LSANTRLIGVSLLSLMLLSVAGPAAAIRKPPLEHAIKRQQNRDEYIRFEAIIDALKISRGMTILDIGAGPGYASYLFAEKLGGTGKVFATEIREDFVDHIAGEARKRGLSNLFPVLVKAEGLDEFYGRHRYDLVFASNVYHALDKRVEYFSRLRSFLNPGGRLVLVLYNQASLFSADDLPDVHAIVNSFSREDGDDPFLKRLSPPTRRLLDQKAAGEELRDALVEDFNRILVDPRFYRDFYGDSYFRRGLFSPVERDFANWLLMTLKEDGIVDRPADRIDPKSLRTVIKLNRLFFIKRFGAGLAGGGFGAYVAAGDANRHTSKYVALRELDDAGYRFLDEVKLSPYFDAVILVPKTP